MKVILDRDYEWEELYVENILISGVKFRKIQGKYEYFDKKLNKWRGKDENVR